MLRVLRRAAHFAAYSDRPSRLKAFHLPRHLLSTDSRTEGNAAKIDISDSCVKKLRQLQSSDPGSFLRVSVESGGCSGFQYNFVLDSHLNDDDKVFERGGVKVVVDYCSLPLLNGAKIEFHSELIRSTFRVAANPQSAMGCSCGSSFSAML